MVQTVYKYPLSMNCDERVKMPEGARIVQVGFDGDRTPCVWALVDPRKLPTVERHFGVYGTGGHVPDYWEYVGTFFDLPFVWHIFEEKLR
jgi:hypothetical protein